MCNANLFGSIQFHSIAFAIPPISIASVANSNICTHAQAHTWKRLAADLHGGGWVFQFILVRNCSTAHNGKVAAVFADANIAHWKSCRVPHTAHPVHLTQSAYAQHMLNVGRCNRTTCYNININMYSCEVLQHNLFPFNLHIILNWRRRRRRRPPRVPAHVYSCPRCAWV